MRHARRTGSAGTPRRGRAPEPPSPRVLALRAAGVESVYEAATTCRVLHRLQFVRVGVPCIAALPDRVYIAIGDDRREIPALPGNETILIDARIARRERPCNAPQSPSVSKRQVSTKHPRTCPP